MIFRIFTKSQLDLLNKKLEIFIKNKNTKKKKKNIKNKNGRFICET